MNIGQAIQYKYPNADPTKDYMVRDDHDGNGVYLDVWNLSDPRPTDTDLQAWWNEAELPLAKQAKIAELEDALNATLSSGFTSKTTGHSYKTDLNGQTNMEGDIKRFELDSTLTSLMFYTTSGGWISHSHTDLQNAFLDGGKWKDAQYTQFNTLYGQVNSATDIAAVQSIQWTPATY